jgi:hypothetical protein
MSEAIPQNTDAEHLRLLSIFHYVCAGMMALFACFPIFHLIMGLVFMFMPQRSSNGAPTAVFGAIFVMFALFFILLGWITAGLIAWAGRCLSKRIHYTFCLVMAGIECMFMPFGTVLGVFTIVVLVRPSVKTLFNQAAPA